MVTFSVSGFAGPDNFKWVRSVQQQTVRDYSNGLSAYYENGLWGFISPGGKVAIEPAFDEVSDFDGEFARVKKGSKWGVINKTGKLVFDCEYDSITTFTEGVALADFGGLKYYLYSDGKKKNLSTAYEFHAFSNGYARVKDNKNGKWGYVDMKGVIRINPKYDSASDFQAEHAVVTLNGKAYSVNKAGDRKAIDINPGQNFVVFSNGTGYVENPNGTVSFFKKGYAVLPGEYSEIHDFSDGLALAKTTRGSVVYINEEGTIALRLKDYADAGDFSEGVAWVRKNAMYGYVNKKGDLVVDTLFSYASDFNDKLAYVARGQRQGVIKIRSERDVYPIMDISDITLSDSNGNDVVEAEEAFNISFTVRNLGDETLNDAVVTLGLDADQMDWFSYDNTKISVGALNPGESKQISFVGSANTNVVSEGINLTIRGEADNIFSFPSFPYSFTASGISACRPVLETFWVYTEDHSPLTPGREAVLKMTVKNTGTDMAKDVAVNLDWPEGIEFKEKQITIPSLAPNETKEITTTFTVDSYMGGYQQEFSMVAMVDEYTHMRNDVKYISFETGKRNALTNLLSGVSAAMPGEYAAPVTVKKMAQSELLVDLAPRTEYAKNRFALVIGNEDYNSMKQSATYQPDVDFAVRDAETFAKFATNVMGVKEDNVILVKNATYAQMKSNLEKLTKLAKANPDDLELIVYYAGHGQVDGDSKDSYLIPVDVSITSPTAGMKLEDFYGTLSACKAQKTLVFLDACYSGVGRGIIIRPKEALVKGNLVVMTATSSTQRSMPYQEKNHGLFTYYLLKTLKEGGQGMSIGQLFEQVSETVKTKSILINNAEQTPELLNGADIVAGWKDWVL